MDKTLKQLTEMGRAKRVALYNRPDSTHRKIVPTEYGELPPDAFGEAYRLMVQGRESQKKREKPEKAEV